MVKPITMPQPDGEVKLGAGAAEVSAAEVDAAVETTKRLASGPETAATHGRAADTIGAGTAERHPLAKTPRHGVAKTPRQVAAALPRAG